VVTDESYADDRGCMLFRMMSDAGVTLYVVANKLSESLELRRDIKTKLDTQWRGKSPALPEDHFHSLPFVQGKNPEERLGTLLATDTATTLRTAIAREAKYGQGQKHRALIGAADFIGCHLTEVLQPLVDEIETERIWEREVKRLAHKVLLDRYRHEYLEGERYGEFNQLLIRLMDLLEIPGIGPLLKHTKQLVRIPFGMAKRFVTSLLGSRSTASKRPPEQEVLEGLLQDWLKELKSWAQTQAIPGSHPVWAEIVHQLESHALYEQLGRSFEDAYTAYRTTIDEEVKQRAKALYEAIEQRPWLLNTLRGTITLFDTATLVLVIKAGGIDWTDALVGPVVAGIRRVLLQEGLEQISQ
jgi:hypothetical protein